MTYVNADKKEFDAKVLALVEEEHALLALIGASSQGKTTDQFMTDEFIERINKFLVLAAEINYSPSQVLWYWREIWTQTLNPFLTQLDGMTKLMHKAPGVIRIRYADYLANQAIELRQASTRHGD